MTSAGATMRAKGMPPANAATASLSPDKRPKPCSTASSIPIGSVSARMGGR